jgi:hypothetical protein
MERGWFDRLLEKGANLGGSLEFGKQAKDAVAPIASAIAGFNIVEAWNWAAAQGWGFVVILGIVVAYLLLGLLTLARRFLPSPTGIPQHSQVNAPTLVGQEEIARLDGRIAQQQESIDAIWGAIDRQGTQTQEKLDSVAKQAELGMIAHHSIHGMMMLRTIRHPLARVGQYADRLRRLPSLPTEDQFANCSVQLVVIRDNLMEIVRFLYDNKVNGASELKSEMSKLSMERKKQRTFENSSRMTDPEKYERERASLLHEAGIIHSFIQKIKLDYTKLCRAPSGTES